MIEKNAYVLACKLKALPEMKMRQNVLKEHIEKHHPEQIARELNEIFTLGRQGGPPYDVAMIALARVLTSECLNYQTQTALYLAAKQLGFDMLTRLFFSEFCGEKEHKLQDVPAKHPENQNLAQTLGHRKWQARSLDRHLLDRLLRDPEVEVIKILLENPKITQQDVALLASRRPAIPAIQRVIFSSNRWIARYEVKRALILNPYTPTDLSLKLISFLLKSDLSLVQSSLTLPEPVREAAGRFLVP